MIRQEDLKCFKMIISSTSKLADDLFVTEFLTEVKERHVDEDLLSLIATMSRDMKQVKIDLEKIFIHLERKE